MREKDVHREVKNLIGEFRKRLKNCHRIKLKTIKTEIAKEIKRNQRSLSKTSRTRLEVVIEIKESSGRGSSSGAVEKLRRKVKERGGEGAEKPKRYIASLSAFPLHLGSKSIEDAPKATPHAFGSKGMAASA